MLQTDWLNRKVFVVRVQICLLFIQLFTFRKMCLRRLTTLMGISWSRLKDVTQNSSKDRKLVCYFAFGGVFVFCILFYFVRRLFVSQ